MTSSLNDDFQAQRSRERESLRGTVSTLFADEPRAVLELGCGHGHFLTSLATAHPAALHVGVDKLPSRIARGQRKVERAQLNRLHFIHADILDFLELVPRTVYWSAIYVLFPDPWPKRRHHKHRWLQPHTLAALASQAAPGAHLYFKTDVKAFYLDVIKLLELQGDWALVDDAEWPDGPRTIFEGYANESYSLIAQLRK
ncbi:MAG: hypothetical protein B7X06_00800 [Verrucomicrobia bacterium 21-51-4]|nr:MAG: hypothetical protein B7X06_00800 [Verrucomicrobia bacterium 21-51-4]HQU08692.1 methyltransferase domain-containing protein [Opitutales bacterium]